MYNRHAIFLDWQKFSPQRVHHITIETMCTSQKSFRIEQMRSAILVNMYLGSIFRPPTSSPSVIQMDVREKNICDIFDLIPKIIQSSNKSIDGGSRPGLDPAASVCVSAQ